jgi:hypothetical protein
VPLTQAEIEYQAQKACWYVEAEPRNIAFLGAASDSVVLTGDGVEDLDQILNFMATYPNGRYTIDIGRSTTDYRPCDSTDIQGIKIAYMAFYGTVNKPGFPIPFPRTNELPINDPFHNR